MANPHDTQTPASTDEDGHFEADLERAEKRLKTDHRQAHYLGEHPDGIGPTLGQDLGQPNPGHDVDWNDEHYDPPT